MECLLVLVKRVARRPGREQARSPYQLMKIEFHLVQHLYHLVKPSLQETQTQYVTIFRHLQLYSMLSITIQPTLGQLKVHLQVLHIISICGRHIHHGLGLHLHIWDRHLHLWDHHLHLWDCHLHL